MKKSVEIKERILRVLREVYPIDLSIRQVAKRARVSSTSASKYLAVLEAEGKIELSRRIGKAKMYRPKKKLDKS